MSIFKVEEKQGIEGSGDLLGLSSIGVWTAAAASASAAAETVGASDVDAAYTVDNEYVWLLLLLLLQ